VDRISEGKNWLITGAEKSGKTALAKTLFRDFHAKGFVPLLVDGSKLKAKVASRVPDQLYELFGKQYNPASVEDYRQLSPQRRVVIIDNYHKLRLHGSAEATFMELLEQFAAKIILVANDFAQGVSEVIDAKRLIETRESFTACRIAPFGHLRRAALIEKWFLLDPDARNEEEQLAQRIRTVEQTLDVICGKNFVPAYPVFVLAVLQASDSAKPVDTSASTYGYFYEIFIRNALASGSTSIQFDIKSGYLSFLAFKMFSRGAAAISTDEFAAFHREYQDRYAQSHLGFSDMRSELTRTRILQPFGDTFEFKYKYIYYYFVASYIKDHLADSEIRAIVSRLTSELYVEESANIALFLAHVSRDPFIIDEMLRQADYFFPGTQPSTLDADIAFLSDSDKALLSEAETSLVAPTYVETDIDEARRKRLAELDRLDDVESGLESEIPEPSLDDDFKEIAKYAAELGAAFKTLQILGQILKNFPGTLEADTKAKLLRACYALGLRSLSNVLTLIRENRADLVREIAADWQKEQPEATSEELLRRARETVFGLTHMLAFGTIKRVSYAVGLPGLRDTYASIRAETQTNAVELIHTSLHLDQFASFPQKMVEDLGKRLDGQLLPMSILKNLVVNHFHLFPVDYRIRQTICDRLGISYTRLQRTNPRARLVANTSSSTPKS
jgi:hypothetical protein